MIAYIEGKILKIDQDGIILLAGQIGYEILLPVFVLESLTDELTGNTISLYIYYHQTERQPKPVLIGFNTEDEKDFFQIFISVDAIGPLKAVKAMEKPISRIAVAIEQQDVDFLAGLKGIGKRTAQKIIASLHGRLDRFIISPPELTDSEPGENRVPDLLSSGGGALTVHMKRNLQQVIDVLVEQLGYTAAIARKMVSLAIEKNPSIATPEQLLDAVLSSRR